jgi:hypothetical protein
MQFQQRLWFKELFSYCRLCCSLGNVSQWTRPFPAIRETGCRAHCYCRFILGIEIERENIYIAAFKVHWNLNIKFEPVYHNYYDDSSPSSIHHRFNPKSIIFIRNVTRGNRRIKMNMQWFQGGPKRPAPSQVQSIRLRTVRQTILPSKRFHHLTKLEYKYRLRRLQTFSWIAGHLEGSL